MGTKIVFGFLITLLLIIPIRVLEPNHITRLSTFSGSILNITPDGLTLLVVNPDSNTLTFVNTIDQTVLDEIKVGKDPRSVAVTPDGSKAFVANQGNDTLSVVDIELRVVIQTIPVGDRPVNVVISPDGRFAAVAELGADLVRFLDANALSTLTEFKVDDRPHGLSFTPDGQTLLISHLLSGNVTLLAVRPFSFYLPIIIRMQSTTAITHSPTAQQGYWFLTTIPTWQNVGPAPSVIVNTVGTRAYLPQTMAHNQGDNSAFDTTVFPKVSVINLETNSHQSTEHISLPEIDRPVGVPWSAALIKNDTELWVVNAASNDISVLDITNPANPGKQANIKVEDNPRGIVFSADGLLAFVSNGLAGTVSVIDTTTYTITDVITVTTLPLPPALLNGKRLFFSSAKPALTRANWISCNTCHIEGEHDGRTWRLQFAGDVPPGTTPVITRNTTSLLGMIKTYPLRWSAEWDESADSEFSIRFEQFGDGLINGDMHPSLGTPNQGRSYDLDCLALYIDSLQLPDRYHFLSESEIRGKVIFESTVTKCAECHPAPLYTDQKVHDVGTAKSVGELFGPFIDTPTLQFLYDSAPYLHDGSARNLIDVLTTLNPDDMHGMTSHLSTQELDDLIAYLLALPVSE